MTTSSIEELTNEQELKYELVVAVVNQLPDALVVADYDGKIRLVNYTTEKMFGYHRDEMLGQAIEMLLPEKFRAQHVEHRRRFWLDPQQRLMGKGAQLSFLTKDGVEVAANIMLSPLILKQGRFAITLIRRVKESQ